MVFGAKWALFYKKVRTRLCVWIFFCIFAAKLNVRYEKGIG